MIYDKLEYNSKLSKYIVDYLEEKKAIHHNVYYLKYILRDLDRYIMQENIETVDDISKEIINKWLIKKDTESCSTRKTRANILKQFLIYLSKYIDNIYMKKDI